MIPNELRQAPSCRSGGGTMRRWLGLLALAALASGTVASARAQAQQGSDETELSKRARNPLPDIVIVPIQNNTNRDYGPAQGMQDGINVQPLISFRLFPGANLITRTVIPFIVNPELGRIPATSGLGDVQFTPYLSPDNGSHWTFGLGPVLQIPTHTDPMLGNNNFGLGPAFAVFHASKTEPWVLGLLANTAWSLGTDPHAPRYAAGSFQPLLSYHISEGIYLTSSPMIKADWTARPDHQVLLPLGGGIGKLFHLGNVALNAEVSAYYNVMKRDLDADWQLRVQFQVLFPR